jgi:hypothetical protein
MLVSGEDIGTSSSVYPSLIRIIPGPLRDIDYPGHDPLCHLGRNDHLTSIVEDPGHISVLNAPGLGIG